MTPPLLFRGQRTMTTMLANSCVRVSILPVLLVAALLCTSFSASAMDRSSGDYWTYSMVIVVPGFDVATTGTVKYEFVSQETLTVNSAEVPVNVVRVTGDAGGSLEMIDLEAQLVMEGYIYEGLHGMSVVREDITSWTNLTWGSGPFSFPINRAIRVVSTYTPPLMSGFDPDTTEPGSTWVETTSVQTVTTNLTDDAQSEWTTSKTVTYTISSQLETVSTGVGDFDALRIVAVHNDGLRVQYWWSEEADVFVREETYLEDVEQPVQTLVLEEYNGGPGSNILVYVAVGGAATAVALVALVAVLMMRRPRRPDIPDTSPPLELLPPPP
jgi:hypothetical protein